MTKKQRKAKNKLEKAKWLMDVAMCDCIQFNDELARIVYFGQGEKAIFAYFIKQAKRNKKWADNRFLMANVRYEAALKAYEEVM